MPKGTVVLGISKDTVQAQKAFADAYELKFSLLADDDGAVIKTYGVDGLMGFAQRKTFLVDRKGKVAKIYESVNPLTHAAHVVKDLAEVP
jgi:peroxiredoxin Q/BCP